MTQHDREIKIVQPGDLEEKGHAWSTDKEGPRIYDGEPGFIPPPAGSSTDTSVELDD